MKTKAILVTKDSRVYRDFIRKHKLNSAEYPWVSKQSQLLQYVDVPAFILYGAFELIDSTYRSILYQHDIDEIRLDLQL